MLSSLLLRELLVVALVLVRPLAEFPNSSSPVTAAPPVKVKGVFCGSSAVFAGLELKSWGVAYGNFTGNPCPESVSITGVVLRLHGAVRGVQFDRYGALWVGGVEVLRTTTPEPTAAGIHWTVDRDLTEYSSLFLRTQNVSISIPNTVDAHYTGVLRLNVSFDFYGESRSEHAVAEAGNAIYNLLNRSELLLQPWDVMKVAGHGWMNLSLPSIPRHARRSFLDVFASGHGCEEFEAGYDCGGPLRRLRVYIHDETGDHLAGVTYPFPVIYTGGINPLLWRPLTGISSFDLPPYRFDITPFIPLLLDGVGKTVSITMDGNTPSGFWFLDPVLVCSLSNVEEDRVVGGELTKAELRGNFTERNMTNQTILAMDISNFHVQGVLRFAHPNSNHQVVDVRGELSAWASYTTIGAAGGPTTPPDHRIVSGQRRGVVTVTESNSTRPRSPRQSISFDFPYRIELNQTENGNAFNIQADVSYGRHGSFSSSFGEVSWRNQISSTAVYQRDQNFSTVVAENNAAEQYQVRSSVSGLCYNKVLNATNGSIIGASGGSWSCNDDDHINAVVRRGSAPATSSRADLMALLV